MRMHWNECKRPRIANIVHIANDDSISVGTIPFSEQAMLMLQCGHCHN